MWDIMPLHRNFFFWITLLLTLREAVSADQYEVIASAGDSISLICKTYSQSVPVWYYPKKLRDSNRFQIESTCILSNGRNTCISNFTLNQTNIDDSGEYRCSGSITEKSSIQDSSGSRMPSQSISKQFHVFVSDNNTLLTTVPMFAMVFRGTDLELPCISTVKGSTVQLKKVRDNFDFSRVTYDRASGYVIRNVSVYDDGSWECTANYGKKTTIRRIYVKTVPSPRTTSIQRVVVKVIPSKISLVNDSITIRCEVECEFDVRLKINITPVSITRKKGFRVSNGNDRQTPSKELMIKPKSGYNVIWQEIKIPRIQMGDAGKYRCFAEIPGFPEVQKNASVQITVVEQLYIKIEKLPQFEVESQKYVVNAVKEFEEHLEFIVRVYPTSSLQISQNGEYLSDDWERDHISASNIEDSVIYSMNFANASTDDAGEYIVHFINSKSRERKEVKFTMKVSDPQPPHIMNSALWEKHHKTAIIGQSLKLECQATGAPRPTVQWYKNGSPTSNGSVLEIWKASKNDSGNYTCIAENALGFEFRSVFIKAEDGTKALKFALGFGLAIAAAAVVVVAILLHLLGGRKIKKLRKQLKTHMEYLAPIIDPAEMTDEHGGRQSYDLKKWEIPRDRLRLGKTIGRGAFGRVVQATAFDIDESKPCKTVAVKMLKVGCRNSEHQALMSELQILIHVGQHLNIVNLHGACTTRDGPMMIIVEYCRYGNMSDYLKKLRDAYKGRVRKKRFVSKEFENEHEPRELKRSAVDDGDITDGASVSGESAFVDEECRSEYCFNMARKRKSDTPSEGSTSNSVTSQDDEDNSRSKTRLSDSSSIGSKESIKNASRREFEENSQDMKITLTEADLLSYSYQVARGMEFLASKKFIHRDLAARNILISDYDVVKICDFGLARDVYRDPDYIRREEARLPLKWMALESIFDQTYSTKSDVWSFGVLLWEIFSLGASPYPGCSMDEEFFDRLKDGVRMKKPQHAPDRVYDSMLACWQQKPSDRPTFTKLAEEFSDILQSECENEYLDMMKIFQQTAKLLNQRKVIPVIKPDETFDITVVTEETNPANYLDVSGKSNAEAGTSRETSPLITESAENVHSISAISPDCSSLERDTHHTPSSRPSLDAGVASANETPPSYNALMAV